MGNKNSLQISYANQAVILKAWGRLEEAMALHKKEEGIALDLGNKGQLQRSYGNQALILIQQQQLDEALELLKKKEAICLDLGLKRDLGYCYWYQGWLAGKQGDKLTEKQKLQQSLAFFAELNMPRERDKVQSALDQLNSAGPAASKVKATAKGTKKGRPTSKAGKKKR